MEAIREKSKHEEENNIPEGKDKIKHKNFTPDDMKNAFGHLGTGKSIREASRLSNVPYATVRRHWLKFKDNSPIVKEEINSPQIVTSTPKLKSILKKPSKIFESNDIDESFLGFKRDPLRLFTEKQEITLATLFNGKNGNECRRIAYEMAVEWNVPLDKTWSNNEMADKEWMTNFRKRLPDLLEKQYRNTQKDLAKESSSIKLNPTSTKSVTSLGTNRLAESLCTRQSASSELDSFGNESSNSNNDVDIVKLEPNEYENRATRPTPLWEKGFSNMFSGNRKRVANTPGSGLNQISLDDVKVFVSDKHDNLEKRNFLITCSGENKISERQDDICSISGRSSLHSNIHNNMYKNSKNNNSNNNNSNISNNKKNNTNRNRAECEIDDDNTTTSLYIISDNDNSNDSDITYYTNKSKKSKNDDIQIGQKDFVKMVKGMNAVTKKNMDADELFLLSLLPALKRIADKDKLKAKIKLLEVFDQFE